VVGEQGLKDELKKAGIRVINDHSEGWEQSSEVCMSADEFSSVQIDESVRHVVAGINYDFSYRTLCIASLYI
jgi:hypothetical protein